MAAKRFLDESSHDPDRSNEKRMRNRPSFSSVITQAVMVNSLQNLCMALEPMLRRVVNEEVDNSLKRCLSRSFTRSPSLRIQAPESSPSSLQLMFRRSLLLPIFTGSKIVDIDNSSLQILLVDKKGDSVVPTSVPHPIKLEIVVLDGDFLSDDRNSWTAEEFDRNILKERTGKRPLLAGNCLMVTLRDGIAPVGEIEFTDNSSWIRSRKFRIGARVASGSSPGVRIHEAITEAFVVKDHRGELYKKHHPPMLDDEVWRLEKIGKDGAFHRKLSAEGIHTVQEFLKLSIVDQQRLRTILGSGMSERIWEATIKHAKTCEIGNKRYILHGHNFSVTVNPICQVVSATIDGQSYSISDLPRMNRSCIQNLVKEAYANWSSLQEVVGVSSEIALLKQGEVVEENSNQHPQAKPIQQQSGYSDVMGDSYQTSADMGYSNWHFTSPLSPGIHYSMCDSSSQIELTPKSYINRN